MIEVYVYIQVCVLDHDAKLNMETSSRKYQIVLT